MDKCKYIVFEEMQTQYLTMDNVMIIFPAMIEHDTMVKNFPKNKPISAGFIDLKSRYCYGGSHSLKLECNPKIDNLMLKLMYKE